KITPDTLGTIPHPLLFLISGRPWDGVSGAVVDTAANSVAVAGTSLSTPGVFGFAQSDVSAASNLAGTGLRAPGRPLDRSLSSKRGRRRGAVRAHPLFRLRTHSPSASDPFAADAPGPPKHHVIPQGERRCRRIANRPRSGTLTACGHLGPDLGPPSSPDAITSWSPRIAPMI